MIIKNSTSSFLNKQLCMQQLENTEFFQNVKVTLNTKLPKNEQPVYASPCLNYRLELQQNNACWSHALNAIFGEQIGCKKIGSLYTLLSLFTISYPGYVQQNISEDIYKLNFRQVYICPPRGYTSSSGTYSEELTFSIYNPCKRIKGFDIYTFERFLLCLNGVLPPKEIISSETINNINENDLPFPNNQYEKLPYKGSIVICNTSKRYFQRLGNILDKNNASAAITYFNMAKNDTFGHFTSFWKLEGKKNNENLYCFFDSCKGLQFEKTLNELDDMYAAHQVNNDDIIRSAYIFSLPLFEKGDLRVNAVNQIYKNVQTAVDQIFDILADDNLENSPNLKKYYHSVYNENITRKLTTSKLMKSVQGNDVEPSFMYHDVQTTNYSNENPPISFSNNKFVDGTNCPSVYDLIKKKK